MRVFITGASGFVGGALAAAIKGKHAVKAMSRSERSDEKIRALGAEPVRCDLESIAPEHLRDIDLVVHSAAYVEPWGTEEDYRRGNVLGTENMLKAASEAGVKRFIHIGTEAALFHGQHMIDIDETYPYALQSPFLYSRTKAQAEKLVLAANRPDFQALSIRPRLIWGPGDLTILPEVLKMLEAGRFMWIDGGRARTVTTHIHNLVHAIVLAFDKGKGGEAYFVTDDEIVTMRDFLTRLVKTAGKDIKASSMPGGLVRALVFLVEGAWRLVGAKKEPPLTRFAANIMSRDCVLNIDKAKAELGYNPVISVDEGLRALAAP